MQGMNGWDECEMKYKGIEKPGHDWTWAFELSAREDGRSMNRHRNRGGKNADSPSSNC